MECKDHLQRLDYVSNVRTKNENKFQKKPISLR
jgi:hypothetical protein